MPEKTEPPPIDCEWNSLPVCPHCGAKDPDWHDGLGHVRDEQPWGAECPICEKAYKVTMFTSLRFETEKIDTDKPLPCPSWRESDASEKGAGNA